MDLTSQKMRKSHIIYAVTALVILLLGIFAGWLPGASARGLSKEEQGIHQVPMDQIIYDGFVLKDGKLLLSADTGFIHVPIRGKYVEKLKLSFDYQGLLNLKAYAGVYNIYGELNENDEMDLVDRNSKLIKESYLNIRKKTEYVNLVVKREELSEPGLSYIDFNSYPLTFTDFSVVNIPQFYPYTMLFVWCIFGLLAFFWFGRKLLGVHPEFGFLAAVLSLGVLLVLTLPVNKIGWDEEVHFEQAFWISNYKQITPVSENIHQIFSPGIDTWPYNQPGSMEESRLLNRYWNETGDYKHGSVNWSADLNKLTMTGYLTQGAFLRIGQALSMPFSMLHRFGRLGNLLIYACIMFLAIRLTPVGKGILLLVGLMPTSVFQACVYSYDPTVTAFMCLFMALVLREALTPGRTMTGRKFALICLVFFAGCIIKAVYAPLMLAALCIPREKYKSEKQWRWMLIGFGIAVVLMMLGFILPVLLSPREVGDLRGGATSEVGQMSYILGQPIAYAKILLTNMIKTLPSYSVGELAFGQFGHLGGVSFTWIFYALVVAVTLTNSQTSTGMVLSGKQKAWIGLLIFGCMSLIWTALYISYTEPGNTIIQGVQGRYYIPFLFPLYLLFTSRRVVVHWENKNYYTTVLAVVALVLGISVYSKILVPMWM